MGCFQKVVTIPSVLKIIGIVIGIFILALASLGLILSKDTLINSQRSYSYFWSEDFENILIAFTAIILVGTAILLVILIIFPKVPAAETTDHTFNIFSSLAYCIGSMCLLYAACEVDRNSCEIELTESGRNTCRTDFKYYEKMAAAGLAIINSIIYIQMPMYALNVELFRRAEEKRRREEEDALRRARLGDGMGDSGLGLNEPLDREETEAQLQRALMGIEKANMAIRRANRKVSNVNEELRDEVTSPATTSQSESVPSETPQRRSSNSNNLQSKSWNKSKSIPRIGDVNAELESSSMTPSPINSSTPSVTPKRRRSSKPKKVSRSRSRSKSSSASNTPKRKRSSNAKPKNRNSKSSKRSKSPKKERKSKSKRSK